MKAQPKGSAPVSRDVVEVVKQKLAPPRGPPPAGMANFKAPKAVNRDTYNERDVSADSYDMDEADHRGHARHRDNDYDDYDNDRNRRGGRGHRDDDEDNNDNRRRRGDRNDRNRDDDYDDYDDTRRDRYDDDSISRSNYKDRRKDRTDDRSRGREDLEIAVHEDTNSTNKTWKKGGRDMEIKHLKPESPKPQVRNASALPEAKPVQDTASNQSQQTKLVLFNYQPVLRATYRELKEFVTKPAAPGVTTRCYIERNRSGSKMLAPFYSLCADLEGEISYTSVMFHNYVYLYYFQMEQAGN